MTTMVKVCGLTTLDDARAALDAGADLIGLNLVAGPRILDLDVALEIASQLPDVSRVVALVPVTSDTAYAVIVRRLRGAGVRKLQLYGDATPGTFADLRNAGVEALAVLRAQHRASLDEFSALLSACGDAGPNYVVLDAYRPKALGGTGRRADWDMIAEAQAAGVLADWPPVILAGGLTTENVAPAIVAVAPFGVDVSSGVEASPGRKDLAKVGAFVAAAKSGSEIDGR